MAEQRLWGRVLYCGNLTMSQGRPVAAVPPQAKISPDYPLLASLTIPIVDNGRPNALEFRSLVLGELLQSMYFTGPRNER